NIGARARRELVDGVRRWNDLADPLPLRRVGRGFIEDLRCGEADGQFVRRLVRFETERSTAPREEAVDRILADRLLVERMRYLSIHEVDLTELSVLGRQLELPRPAAQVKQPQDIDEL